MMTSRIARRPAPTVIPMLKTYFSGAYMPHVEICGHGGTCPATQPKWVNYARQARRGRAGRKLRLRQTPDEMASEHETEMDVSTVSSAATGSSSHSAMTHNGKPVRKTVREHDSRPLSLSPLEDSRPWTLLTSSDLDQTRRVAMAGMGHTHTHTRTHADRGLHACRWDGMR